VLRNVAELELIQAPNLSFIPPKNYSNLPQLKGVASYLCLAWLLRPYLHWHAAVLKWISSFIISIIAVVAIVMFPNKLRSAIARNFV